MGSRSDGTNPRALGRNPRALEVSARALGVNPRATAHLSAEHIRHIGGVAKAVVAGMLKVPVFTS